MKFQDHQILSTQESSATPLAQCVNNDERGVTHESVLEDKISYIFTCGGARGAQPGTAGRTQKGLAPNSVVEGPEENYRKLSDKKS